VFYPAGYGGIGSTFSGQLIVVGAHGPDREPAGFSNFGQDKVDILAPGCAMRFEQPGHEPVILHGTSAAAPLVTFAGAIIHAFGIHNPYEIRLRILTTGDVDPSLRPVVGSSSLLNIERAIAIFHDSVRKRGSVKDSRGKWITEQSADICVDGGPFVAERILRVDSVNSMPDELHLRIIHRDVGGKMASPIECKPKGSGITLGHSDGTNETILWGELQTLVTAYTRSQ